MLTAATEMRVIVSYQNQVSSEYYCLLMYGQTCSVLVEVRTQQDIPWKCIGGPSVQALSVQSLTSTAGLGDVCGTELSSSSQQLVLKASVDNIVRSSANISVDITQVDFVGGQRMNARLLDVLTVSLFYI